MARGLLLLALSLPLVLRPPVAVAQIDRLPDLGGTGSGELSGGDERRIGESIMRELRADGTVLDDAEFTAYLNRFAAPLAATAAMRGTRIEIFAVPDGSINAFALPGGNIGVHTGLIAEAGSESELASVLSHEMGHLVQHHISRMLGQQRQASLLMLASLMLAALAARSGGDAAIGALSLGQSVALRQLLSFSRENEREADRVGLTILADAGFDVRAAPRFFQRLQHATRFSEGDFPAYMRTHPMTGERMTDLELRIQKLKPVVHEDRLEFRLLRARARAISASSNEGLRALRREYDEATSGGGANDPVAWFGLACVAASQKDLPRAAGAIATTRRLLGTDHPFIARLSAATMLDAGDADDALKEIDAARRKWPDAVSLIRLRGQALIAVRDNAQALTFLREQTDLIRGDAELWRLLGEAYQGLGQKGMAHRAAAESYLIGGQLRQAIEQLRYAQRVGDLDFINGSIVDAKLREAESAWRDEQRDKPKL